MLRRLKRIISRVLQIKYFEVKAIKKIRLNSGEEVTEEKNGCHISGFLVSSPDERKIVDIGTGSRGVVIPPSMLSRIKCDYFKIYLIEQFGEIPVILLTHPKMVLEVGKKNG